MFGGVAIAVRVLAAANFSTYKHARSPFKPFALERTSHAHRAEGNDISSAGQGHSNGNYGRYGRVQSVKSTGSKK